jgi:hypothetical protein
VLLPCPTDDGRQSVLHPCPRVEPNRRLELGLQGMQWWMVKRQAGNTPERQYVPCWLLCAGRSVKEQKLNAGSLFGCRVVDNTIKQVMLLLQPQ